jgi:hypothetical protein
LAKERYFFAVQRDSLSSSLMQQFIDLLLGDSYRAFVGQLPGYDATDLGKVLSPRQAFGTSFGQMSKAA